MTADAADLEQGTATTRVGVAGCGLIGGSVLLGLAGLDRYELAAFDPDPEVRRALDHAGIETTGDVQSLARRSEIVVVAAPPAVTGSLVAAALVASERVVVTDVASVKGAVIDTVTRLVGPELARDRFIAGHPLAGSERRGFGAASADLFDGSVWALCPSPSAPLDHVLAVSRMAWSLGASVLAIDAGAHDVAVAYSSHAPHIVASAIAQAPPPELRAAVALLSGGGLRDATRVAASDGALWVQIVEGNRVATLAALDAQQATIAALRGAVEREDWEALRGHWALGRDVTEGLLAARWKPRAWSTAALTAQTTEALLDLGRAGQLVRAARVDDSGGLRLEISSVPVSVGLIQPRPSDVGSQ